MKKRFFLIVAAIAAVAIANARTSWPSEAGKYPSWPTAKYPTAKYPTAKYPAAKYPTAKYPTAKYPTESWPAC